MAMTLQEIIAELGGVYNPNTINYTSPDRVEVKDPVLRSVQQYLQQLGAEDYVYDYATLLNNLNNATEQGYKNTLQQEQNAQNEYLRGIASNQAAAADTIRQQQAQAIQQGISKGMQNANLLSTLLGTSQSASEGAQKLAEQRATDYNAYAKQLLDNANSAMNTHNANLETLMGNIRQLYNDEIQNRTASLEYNASLEETLANVLANKYAADTNYTNNINSAAAGIYSTLAQLANAAANSTPSYYAPASGSSATYASTPASAAASSAVYSPNSYSGTNASKMNAAQLQEKTKAMAQTNTTSAKTSSTVKTTTPAKTNTYTGNDTTKMNAAQAQEKTKAMASTNTTAANPKAITANSVKMASTNTSAANKIANAALFNSILTKSLVTPTIAGANILTKTTANTTKSTTNNTNTKKTTSSGKTNSNKTVMTK